MHEAAVLVVWVSLEPEMQPFLLLCMVFLLTAGILNVTFLSLRLSVSLCI